MNATVEHTAESPTLEGNVAENWRLIQQFHLYMNATGINEKEEKTQCSALLTFAGKDAVEVFNMH